MYVLLTLIEVSKHSPLRPSRSMSLSETSKYCHTCKKVFCCVECRKRHDQKQHSNRHANCPLCWSKKLPLRATEDEDLLCHIIFNHLPLYCCLCGQLFKQSKDLRSFGTCKWYEAHHRHCLVTDPTPQLETPPPISELKRPETSSIHRESSQEFVSLTSPPVLYRQTSTPMIVGQKTSFAFKTPNVPNFSLKTPKTNSAASTKCQIRSGNITYSDTKDSNSNFVSFSINSSNSVNTPFRTPSLMPSNKFSITKDPNKTGGIELLEEHSTDNHDVEDMELTGIEGSIPLDSRSNSEVLSTKLEKRSDSIKKVRFSDQFDQDRSAAPSPTSLNATENEEFFEARDTMSDTKEVYQSIEELKLSQETRKSEEKENHNTEYARVNINQQPAGTSRVLMMLVVENKSELSTSDLVPLIDTGLKQLGSIQQSSTPPPIPTIPNTVPPECSTSTTTSVDCRRSVSNYKRYSSASVVSSSAQLETKSSEIVEASSSGGIFSAVAHAVRTVMKNFSGTSTSKTVSREELSEEMMIASSTVETSKTISSRASPVLHRPSKRPRDTTESASPASSSSSRQMDLVLPSQVEPRSPLAKRHRGWYSRIKGREPLSRMRGIRHITPSKGISSERQIFSQGSLSVRDTILPLPARAHQSTQTE